jgi:hypothetical protein
MISACLSVALLAACLGAEPNGAVLQRRALQLMGRHVRLDFTEVDKESVRVRGAARTHEDVAEYMKALESQTLTPRSWGRVVMRQRNSPVVRLELDDGTIVEHRLDELRDGADVELLAADQTGAKDFRLSFELIFRFKPRRH